MRQLRVHNIANQLPAARQPKSDSLPDQTEKRLESVVRHVLDRFMDRQMMSQIVTTQTGTIELNPIPILTWTLSLNLLDPLAERRRQTENATQMGGIVMTAIRTQTTGLFEAGQRVGDARNNVPYHYRKICTPES
jgi:hypothetical protein